MPDYKSMYGDLFNAVTKAIEILKEAQIKAENTYVDTSVPDYELITESDTEFVGDYKSDL